MDHICLSDRKTDCLALLLSVFPLVNLVDGLSLSLSLSLSLCLPSLSFVCLTVYLLVYPSIRLFLYFLSVYIVHLSYRMSVYLSISVR